MNGQKTNEMIGPNEREGMPDVTNETAERAAGADPDKLPAVKLPVTALLSGDGIIARDIRAADGSIVMPAGVDFSMFARSAERVVRRMQEAGITHVYVHHRVELGERDLESVIDRVWSLGDSSASRGRAANSVEEIGALFDDVGGDGKNGRDNVDQFRRIRNLGTELASDLMRDRSITFSLAKVGETDEYTFVHSYNVAMICGFLAKCLYPEDRDFIERMITGGLLHDIGKSRISSEILNKPGKLTHYEFGQMKRHPAMGVKIAMENGGITDPDIIAAIGGHHERWSGDGYPARKTGTNIPEAARITAVADVFDALTAKRAYDDAISSRNAVSVILNGAGTQFDAAVCRALLTGIGLYPPGTLVLLSDGRRGIVVSGGGRDIVRPLVMIDESDPPEFIDLRQDREYSILQYLGHSGKRDLQRPMRNA